VTLVLFALAVSVVCMPRWLSPLIRRLLPTERVHVGVAALMFGAFFIELSLVLLAVPAVLGAVGNESLAVACRRFLGDLAPGGLEVGWAALALAVLLPLLARRGWVHARSVADEMRAEPSLGTHGQLDGVDLVRLPTNALVAYSLGGPRPQIILSDGLAALLTPAELDVVIGHEMAHVRQGHGRLLRLLAAFETAVPAFRRVTSTLRVAVERSADEAATGQDPFRRHALLDALLKIGDAAVPTSVPAFTSRSGVVERAEALLCAPPQPTRVHRVVARMALGGAIASSLVVLGGWAFEAHMMLSMAGICRM
jgi:hypothetical protein